MKNRPDSYEAMLSEEQREQLYAWLSVRSASLAEVRELCPVWPQGRYEGGKPSIVVLSKIYARIQLEARMLDLEATAKMMEAVRCKLSSTPGILADQQEQTLDTAIALIGQEVIEKTLAKEDPKNRTAAARLMLKRAEHRRFDRRMTFLESQVKQAKAVTQDAKLSPEERQLRMKEIFGIQ